MQENIRTDIIDSYNELIEVCKENIKDGIEIDKNELLIEEYSYVLKKVEKRSKEEYESQLKEIEKLYEVSLVIMSHLSPLMPYKEHTQ